MECWFSFQKQFPEFFEFIFSCLMSLLFPDINLIYLLFYFEFSTFLSSTYTEEKETKFLKMKKDLVLVAYFYKKLNSSSFCFMNSTFLSSIRCQCLIFKEMSKTKKYSLKTDITKEKQCPNGQINK
ncbi:hypothetical protein Dsin_004135 [Dipteronia sinensis]|uniref:Uncharacterized protein n=1 Tax=Dipteronia sinensis TaxID=43782 RepID=A0AAE0ELB5_9ROSI|nr:hypothetical protein Dsin_004135 [Dipteronia sinensis]